MMTSANRTGSAKRSASGNLSNSSDDEQDDELRELESSRISSTTSPSSSVTVNTVSDQETANSSFDSNDNPCSPGGSSTSSGPIYIRPPGFKYHAQEILRPRLKKKKKVVYQPSGSRLLAASKSNPIPSQDVMISSSIHRRVEPPVPPAKHRQTKRDPLPMRMRAFPQSFWQQPNQPVAISPASCHKVLPPLPIKDEMDQLRPVTPPTTDDKHVNEPTPAALQVLKDKTIHTSTAGGTNTGSGRSPKLAERKIIMTGNPDHSLTKLFESVEEKAVAASKRSDNGQLSSSAAGGSCSTGIKSLLPPSHGGHNKRTASRFKASNMVSVMNKTMLHGCDPYMVDTITDKLFPHLTLEKSGVRSYHNSNTTNGATTSLQLITLREGDKSVTLPSLCIEQNYSQMLSELVPHL